MRQRRLNSAATHPCDVIDTAIDWEEIGKRWFSELLQNILSIFKPRHSKGQLWDSFTGLMMDSESCSTYSLSFGDDLFPFILLRKVMKSLRRSYDKKRSTIRRMKQTQLQLKFNPVKTKVIQTWTCGRLLLEWGTHSGVSAESASRGIEDRTAPVVLIMPRE